MTENAVVARDPKTGQLLPGAKLNPNGRGEGNRALITRQKQDLEIALRAYPALSDHLTAVLQRVVLQAKGGCRQSQKVLMDKFLSNAKEADPRDGDTDKEFRLVIVNLTQDDIESGQGSKKVIDVTPEEVHEHAEPDD